MSGRDVLGSVQRLVVKVGSSTITHANGRSNLRRMDHLARELTELVNEGKEVVLVSSGAVAVGVSRMGLATKPRTIPGKQAAAAVGQGVLMHTYEQLFADYGQTVAQVLLTRIDSVDRQRYTNCRNTFLTLLHNRVIPIVNENDVVAVDELKIGDNDNLSATVAGIVDADLVIILSDVAGLYTANPQVDPTARLIAEVAEVTPEIEAMAGGAGSSVGTGGMRTKLEAARAANSSGIHLVICSGTEKGAISRILAGESVGTLFRSNVSRLQFRKRWLAFGSRIMGSITVDAGCVAAMHRTGSCSILPAGICSVNGTFAAGSTISVVDECQREVARGLTNYSSEEIGQILGLRSDAIESVLGHKHYDEVIHRDDLVLL